MKKVQYFALKIKKQPLKPVNKLLTAICKLALKFRLNCPNFEIYIFQGILHIYRLRSVMLKVLWN